MLQLIQACTNFWYAFEFLFIRVIYGLVALGIVNVEGVIFIIKKPYAGV